MLIGLVIYYSLSLFYWIGLIYFIVSYFKRSD